MRTRKRLLRAVVVVSVLVGMSVPAGAGHAVWRLGRAAAGEEWSPPRQVPIPTRDVAVLATAISDRGHIALAFTTHYFEGPAYVIVRGTGGVWGTPHRLNPRTTVTRDVELAFDARGNLTAFWSFGRRSSLRPEPFGYRVATKPAARAWTAHVRAGPLQPVEPPWGIYMSVAPSGAAVIGWPQLLEPDGGFQFTVRVRPSARARWGPAEALSSYPATSDRSLSEGGGVAINDDGTAVAAWMACRPGHPPLRVCQVQRSTLTRSGAWTAPVTLTSHAARYPWIEVASTPTGFTAITWIRYHNGRWQTVVTLRTAAGTWSREVVGGAHTDLAVGPRGTVAMAKLRLVGDGAVSLISLRVTWRNNHTEWTTDRLAPRQSVVEPVEVAVDELGRIFVTWSQRPVAASDPDQVGGFSAIHRRVWRMTMLWDSAPHAYLRGSAVASNGRAVTIWGVSDDNGTRTTAVLMRVLRPG